MEESKQQQQQQLLLQLQHQQQMQQRQQQLFLMQHLQKQQQQSTISRFPSNIDAHFRLPGMIQNRPANLNSSPVPNLIQQTQSIHQQQQNVSSQQQKSIRPLNHLELQFAYQDAWRVCHPDFKRPFTSLEDACERLLPYHVVADYEAEEEDDRILETDTTNQTLPRCQQWDNNIATKVSEFAATFEKQCQAFNIITQKRREGELRSEEKLMTEQFLLQEERKACIELKSELDRERLRMVALAQAESQQQSQNEMMMMMARGNAIGNYGEQRRNVNPYEMMMMMMNGLGNNSSSQRDVEKEPLEDFLNDEENENEKLGVSGEFDLNTR